MFETILTAILLHGLCTVGLPGMIPRWTGGSPPLALDIGRFRWLGAPLPGFGVYLYVWSAVHLLPGDTSAVPGARPTALVTDRWYSRTRNPLPLGVVTILLGEAALFSSPAVAGYALAYWLGLTVFVIVKEKPDLRRAFGAAFDAYCRDVPRWIPRF